MKLKDALNKIPPVAIVPAKYAKVATMAVNSVVEQQERERIERIKNGLAKQ